MDDVGAMEGEIMSSLTRCPATAEMRYARCHTVSIQIFIPSPYRNLLENGENA